MSQIVYYKIETDKNFNSLLKIPTLLSYAKERSMQQIGIADVQAMYSVMDFYQEAMQQNVKPIIATQFKVIGSSKENTLFITCVAKNYEGYLEIVKLLNHINTTQSAEKKVVPFKEFPKMKHVIVTVSMHKIVEKNRIVMVQPIINTVMKQVGKENVWLELEPAFTGKEKQVQQEVVSYAKEKEFSIIASPSVRYVTEQDKKVMTALEKIKKKQKGKVKNEATYTRFLTEEEEKKAYENCEGAIEQTQKLANLCHISFPLKGTKEYERKMPMFTPPSEFVIPEKLPNMFATSQNLVMPKEEEKVRQIAYLCDKAWRGFLKYYANHQKKKEVGERLKTELGVVILGDIYNYFLIVQDWIRYAKEDNIPIGPGRGSVVGSVLAYFLGIIDIDPIEFELLFERFLNEYRMKFTGDEPDIDIDVSKKYRYKMLEYALKKYGKYNVAKVVTFNPFGGKRALEAVAKLYKVSDSLIDTLKQGMEKTIEELLQKTELLQQVKDKIEHLDEILQIAQKIQHVPDSRSVHAAAVVLSKNDLRGELPIIMTKDKDMTEEMPLIQFTEDNKNLEKLGYTKIDLLSLRTLDVIEDTKKLVKERKGEDVSTIPLDAKEGYQYLQTGHTTGLFQLGSERMQQTAKKTAPKGFRDVINLVALYRPGGKDEIDHYVENKNKNNRIVYGTDGKPIEGVEELETILYRTYGIMVYQEQIMMITGVWSGYDLGEADILRRAISKKNKKVLEKERKTFVERALDKGRDEQTSQRIYDLIVKFADFGFNESHAVAYAKIAFEMAYLKAKYPVEFMSALITSVMDETVDAAEYVQEAKRMGITVLKPSIQTIQDAFIPMGDAIAFGLPMVKHVNEKSIRRIVEERNKKPFLNFTDFLNRTHSNLVDKKILKALIAIDVFEEFGNQNQLLHMLEHKEEPLKLPKNQYSFTDLSDMEGYDLIEQLPDVEDVSLQEKIKQQKEYTCMVLEKTPIDGRKQVYTKLLQRENKVKQTFGGVITNTHVFQDKNKKEMAYVQIEGVKGEVRAVLFADAYEKYKQNIELYAYVLFTAKKDENRNQYVINHVEPVSDVRMFVQFPMEVRQMENSLQKEWVKRFENILENHLGEQEVFLTLDSHKKVYQASITDDLIQDLSKILKEGNLSFEKVR